MHANQLVLSRVEGGDATNNVVITRSYSLIIAGLTTILLRHAAFCYVE
jgi:hypothetical protein